MQIGFDFDGHDPGGRRIPLPDGVKVQAVYGGPGECYRYWLQWDWTDDPAPRTLVVGMMNPSSAGHLNSDGTVSWTHRWAVRGGFGRLVVVNASAYRCRDQARLAEVADPMGPENGAYIRKAAALADIIVVGYGKPKVKAVRAHGPAMVAALAAAGKPIHAWALSLDGTPKHPLYLRGDVGTVPLQS